ELEHGILIWVDDAGPRGVDRECVPTQRRLAGTAHAIWLPDLLDRGERHARLHTVGAVLEGDAFPRQQAGDEPFTRSTDRDIEEFSVVFAPEPNAQLFFAGGVERKACTIARPPCCWGTIHLVAQCFFEGQLPERIS